MPKNRECLDIYPVADVQFGAHGVDVSGFTEYVREIETNPFARVLGVGDYVDGISPSNRKLLLAAFVKGELYDVARDMLDSAATDQMQEFFHLVENTIGKWDAVISGHHFWEYQPKNGRIENTDSVLARFLKAPYVPEASSMVVTYAFPKDDIGPATNLRVWASHGQGASGSYSGPLNQLEKMMRGFNADVYIVAHHHKLVAARAVKLDEDPRHPTQLRAKDSVLVGAGSWLRGYMPDEVSYAEAALMVPLATGAAVVRTERKSNGFRVRCEV